MKSLKLALLIVGIGMGTFVATVGAQEIWQLPDDQGYTPLFNGRDLTGWQMQWKGNWRVENGILTGSQDASGGDSWLFSEPEWDDFALILQFRITKGGNSGVALRMPKAMEGRPSQMGYEIQICDADDEYPTGSVFRHVAATKKLHQVEKWNEMYIYAVGNHIVVYMHNPNGDGTLKVLDTRLEGSKLGRIGFQVHGGAQYKDQKVEFRNIRIKDLKPQYKGETSPLTYKVQQIDSLLTEGCSITDINRDGKLDITCGPRWYEAPNWTPHEYRKLHIDSEFASDYGEIAMDVNQDGWMDVVTGGWFTPIMSWYENPGTKADGGLWKEHVIAQDLDGTETIFSGDVDRDGRPDVLVNRYNTAVPVEYFAFVGTNKSESGFERRKIGIYGRGHGEGFGDVNGDGRNDIMTADGWYECPLAPKTQPWKWHGNYKAEHTSIPFLTADLNKDGLADIIFGYAHHFGLIWLEQIKDSAGRQAWIEHAVDKTYSQLHCPLLADMDGDGILDIVTGKRYRGHAGADPGGNEPLCIYWYRVEPGPDPKFTRYVISYDENIGVGMNLTAIDIDNDGDLDLVAPGKTGLYLFENITNAVK